MAKKKATKKARRKGTARTPPFEAYPEWTEAKFFGFLRSALRSASARWPPKYESLNLVTRPYEGPDKRRKKERQCAKCKGWFPTTQTQADHIEPVGRLGGWDDLVPFVQKMFCDVDGFQCLCTTCHDLKTAEERKASREAKENK